MEMLCEAPIAVETASGPQMVGCGKCTNCLINRRREVTARLCLEMQAAERFDRGVTWSTLTYADENLPYAARGRALGEPNLEPRDPVLLLKRLRHSVGSFRYALVGEYGDRKGRPHYHALFFGPKPSEMDAAIREDWDKRFGFSRNVPAMQNDTPARGDARLQRAAYLAGYVVKKLDKVDAEQLGDRHPEYYRASTSPAIGRSKLVLDLHYTRGGAFLLSETGDVARTVRVYGKELPLGRHYRDWLRQELGVPLHKADRLPEKNPPPAPTVEDYHQAAQAAAKRRRQAKLRSVNGTA